MPLRIATVEDEHCFAIIRDHGRVILLIGEGLQMEQLLLAEEAGLTDAERAILDRALPPPEEVGAVWHGDVVPPELRYEESNGQLSETA